MKEEWRRLEMVRETESGTEYLSASSTAPTPPEENPRRRNWPRNLHHLIVALSVSIGLSNVFKFPKLLAAHGSPFLLVYLAISVFVAAPALVLEMAVGQFSSRGPLHSIRLAFPVAEGLGYAFVLAQTTMVAAYNGDVALAFWEALQAPAGPSHRCFPLSHGGINSPECFTLRRIHSCEGDDVYSRRHHLFAKGSCWGTHSVYTQYLENLSQCIHQASRTSPSGVPDVRCAFRLRLRRNGTTLANVFHRSDILDNSFCNNYLVTQSQRCEGAKHRHVRVSWNSARPENGEELLIDLSGLGVNETSHKRARCLDRLLQSTQLGKHCEEKGSGASVGTRPRWELPMLACVLIRYCHATWPGERLTSVSCVRRVVDPLHSYSAAERHRYWANTPTWAPGGSGLRYELGLAQLTVATLVGWLCCRGLRSVVRFATLATVGPLCLALVLAFAAVFVKGFDRGLVYFFRFKSCAFAEEAMWAAALKQAIYSLNIGLGTFGALASHARFRNDVVRDAIAVVAADTAFSVLMSVAVAALAGHLAWETGVSVPEVVREEAWLGALVAQGLELVPAGALLVSLFGTKTALLGLSSAMGQVLMLQTSWWDEWERLRDWPVLTHVVVGVMTMAVGLPLASSDSRVRVEAIERSGLELGLPLLVLVWVLVMVYGYGSINILADLRLMMDTSEDYETGAQLRFGQRVVQGRAHWWLLIGWLFTIPLAFILLLIHLCLHFHGDELSPGQVVLYYLSPVILLLCLCLGFVVAVWCRRLRSCSLLFRPRPQWGPILVKHRPNRSIRFLFLSDEHHGRTD